MKTEEYRSTRRHILFNIFNVLLMLLAITVAGYIVLKKTVNLESEFSSHATKTNKFYREMTELQYYQGYGGFIHNFKNYIIRQEASYLADARADIARINEVLDRLSSSAATDPARAQSVGEVRSVFATYESMLDTAETMSKQGYTAKEIDARVKVGDMPAEAAGAALIGGAIDSDAAFEAHVRREFTSLRRLQYLVGLLVFPAILSAVTNLIIQIRRR